MRIESVHIDKFGKLRGVSLRFSEGMTVIYGGNESGKSTTLAFIRAMLYGLNGRSANLAVNDRKKYMPWGENAMGGSLRLTDGRESWEIVRTFGLTAKGDTCRVVAASTGEILPIPAGKEPGEVLLGLDEEVFSDTLFVSGRGSRLSGDGAALGERMHNLLSSGREDVDLNAVLQRLQAARSAIRPRVRDRGALHEVRQELDAARQRVDDGARAGQEIAALQEAIRKCKRSRPAQPEQEDGRTLLLRLESQLAQEREMERKRRRSRRVMAATLAGSAALTALVCFVLCAVTEGTLLPGWIATVALAILALAALFVKPSAQEIPALEEEIEQLRKTLPQEKQAEEADDGQRLIDLHVRLDRAMQRQQAVEADKQRVSALEKREEALLLRLEALDMAQEELRAAAKERQEGIAPELLRGMEEMLCGMTAGKYESAALTREMKLSIHSEGALRSGEYFSAGTVEQMYLALRLSMARQLSQKSPLPLLLDDPLAWYDDERAQDALELLRDCARDGQQVLLLTCRRRDTKGSSVIEL